MKNLSLANKHFNLFLIKINQKSTEESKEKKAK